MGGGGGVIVKAVYIHQEVLDERGRYIFPSEFKWLMDYFRDPYDPRRLCLALMVMTGLRHEDGVKAKIDWFNDDFTFIKTSQCKAKIRKKDGIIHMKSKPKFVPIRPWLSKLLREYVQYRLRLGHYVGKGLKENRLFPSLSKVHHRMLLHRIRVRHGKEQKWLNDLWMIERRYDINKKLISTKKWYRVSMHAPRAIYATEAYDVCEYDLVATKMITGHDEVKDVARYTKAFDIMEKKEQVARNLDKYGSEQLTPILKGQMRLKDF